MRDLSAPPEIGRPVAPNSGMVGFVQTERSGHEAWARMSIRKPAAASVLHALVAHMGEKNAVVISQKVLAAMLGITDRTVRDAIKTLVAERWIQVVRLHGPGTVAAYVVNSRVAWADKRDKLHLAVFDAAVVADAADQDTPTLDHSDLRKIPMIYPNEEQLPSGPGEDPPSQPGLDGFHHELPAIQTR